MKLERLELKAFGPFTQVSLPFDGRFTVVHGPNEAGKSSMLRALTALLFGIPERTRDNFVHDYAQLRVGATLTRQDGRPLTFWRRKGKVGTLLDPDGQALDDRTLATFCGPLDEARFTALFFLDHGRLREGGSTLLSGGGEVGHSLFEAGTGLLGLKTLLQQLEKEARDLYRPQGSQPVVNRALASHAEARRRLKEHLLRTDDWRRLGVQVDEARAEEQRCSTELQALGQQLERLQRIRHNLTLVGRLRRVRQELEGLEVVPVLADEARDERIRAAADLESGQQQVQDLEANLAHLDRELHGLSVDDALLTHGAALETLFASLGGYRDAASDLPQRLAQRDHFETLAAQARSEVPAAALQRPLTPGERDRLLELVKAHAALTVRTDDLRQHAAELALVIDADKTRLDGLPPMQECSAARALLEEVRAHRASEAQQTDAKANAARLARGIETAVQALPWWQGAPTAFEVLPLPSRETVEQFDAERSEVTRDLQRLDHEAGTLQTEIDQGIAERQALEASGEIASVERVQAARVERDHCWEDVKRVHLQRVVPAREPAETLAVRYERTVVEADRLVDILHADTARVTEHALLTRKLEHLEQQLAQTRRSHAAAQARLADHEARWDAAWQRAGIQPASPRECLGWLTRAHEIRAQMEAEREAQAAVQRLERQVEQAHGWLNDALPALPRALPLPLRIEHASRHLEATEANNRLRHDVEARLAEKAHEQARARTRVESAQQRVDQWTDAWRTALEPLGLDVRTTPAQAESILRALADLATATASLQDQQRRVDGIQKRIASFVDATRGLLQRLSPETRPDTADAAHQAEWLHRRLQEARRAQQTRTSWEEQRQQKTAELERARQRLQQSGETLARLCRSAGCTLDALPEVERRSDLKRRLLAEQTQVEAQLTEANGAGLEGVFEEVATEDRDALPGKLAGLQEQVRRLEPERDEAVARRVELEVRLQTMDGGNRAATAAQEAQTALAELRDGAESYIRLQASAFLLRRAIESYRERHQGPLLSQASTLFSVLTGGSFSAIRTSFDEKDTLVLVGVRPDGTEVGVGGLSDGTLDQMYLALRLAALEHHAVSSEPWPLVLDDVLIHFDDLRARAALGVLQELSRRTQVLFFTHHAHLVDLAEQVCGSALQVVRLQPEGVRSGLNSSHEGQLNGSPSSDSPSAGTLAIR